MAGEDIRHLEQTIAELRARLAALENVIRVSGGGVALAVPGSLTITVGGSATVEIGGPFSLTAQNQVSMQANNQMQLTPATATTLTAGSNLNVAAGTAGPGPARRGRAAGHGSGRRASHRPAA